MVGDEQVRERLRNKAARDWERSSVEEHLPTRKEGRRKEGRKLQDANITEILGDQRIKSTIPGRQMYIHQKE
jgi:hypothetical protein